MSKNNRPSKKSSRWITPRFRFLELLDNEDFEYLNWKGGLSIIDFLGQRGSLTFGQIFDKEMHEAPLSFISFWKNPKDAEAIKNIYKRYDSPDNGNLFDEIKKKNKGEKTSTKYLEEAIVSACFDEKALTPREFDFKDLPEERMNCLIKDAEIGVKKRLKEMINILLGSKKDYLNRNQDILPIIKKEKAKYHLVEKYEKIYLEGKNNENNEV